MQHHMMKHLLCCIAAGIACQAVQARPWTDVSGRTLEVPQWRVEGETVYFLLNGKEVPEPLARLSPADQAFARQWAADHAAKPGDPPAPPPAAKAPEAPKAAADTAKGGPRSHVAKLTNGDVIIQNIPPVSMDKDVGNQLYVTPALTLEKLYQWPTNLLALAKKMGWEPTKDFFDEYKFYEAAAREAHTRALYSEKFNFDDVLRHISLGQPVIVWRAWGEKRDETLIAFTKEFKTHPDAKLPSPRDAAERKKWPTDHSNSNGTTSMIIGCNRQRGEVMLYIPNLGEDYADLRMRKEEMEVSGYGFWYIDPK